MNFNLDFKSIIELCGFIILLIVTWRLNSAGFKAVESKVEGLSEKFDIEKQNALLFVREIRQRYAKELVTMEASLTNLHGQMKSEVFPRLNAVEGDIKKNCQALRDFKEICEIKHKN